MGRAVVRRADGSPDTGVWCFPKLNYDNPALCEYMYGNMTYFIEKFDVDGYRCDVGDLVPEFFWQEGIRRCRALRPDFLMLNEGRPESVKNAGFDWFYGFEWTRAWLDMFLNGHGGNSKALTECQLDLAKKGCRAALLNWWSMVADFNPEWAGGHGGGQETSANLYIDPTMVDLDSVEGMGLINDLGDDMPSVHFDTVKYKGVSVTVPRPTNYYAENGWIGPDDPKKASAEWGREMLETVAAWMVDFIQAFSKTPLPDSED